MTTRAPLLACLILCAALAGCSASLPQRVPDAAAVQALEQYPFATFDKVLQTYVDKEGRVDYARLDAEASDLESYGGLLAITGPKTSPRLLPDFEHQLAWYINAYNTIALLNVLQRYPGVESLAEIINDFFYFTEFDLDGDETDLYNLENATIRPFARDRYVKAGQGAKLGRVHFALNCASASCPKLPDEAFLPDRLEEQLDREARRFVSEPRNVQIDATAGVARLSTIFLWYADDFTNDKGEPINPLAWINLYRAPDAQVDTNLRVEFFDYDWTLNDKNLPR